MAHSLTHSLTHSPTHPRGTAGLKGPIDAALQGQRGERPTPTPDSAQDGATTARTKRTQVATWFEEHWVSLGSVLAAGALAGSAQYALTEALSARIARPRPLVLASVLPAIGMCAYEFADGVPEEG